ncbi:hypothetical protein ACX4ER_002806, partial [Cronobacter dublinensis]
AAPGRRSCGSSDNSIWFSLLSDNEKGDFPGVCASGSCHKLKHPFTEFENVTNNHLQLKAKIIGANEPLKGRENA